MSDDPFAFLDKKAVMPEAVPTAGGDDPFAFLDKAPPIPAASGDIAQTPSLKQELGANGGLAALANLGVGSDPLKTFGSATNTAANQFTLGLAEPFSAAARAAVQPSLGANPDSSFSERYLANRAQQRGAHEAFATENPGINALSSLAGMAASPVAAPAAAALAAKSVPRMMAQGAGIGGVMGAAESPGTTLGGVAQDAGVGAALGGAVPLALGGLSRVVSPNVDPNVQKLMDIKVRPAPGQMMGGWLNRVEEGLGSIPFVGDFVKGGRGEAVEQFNRGVINSRALAPIGEALDPKTPLGRAAIDEMQTKISNNLNQFKAVPVVATHDPQFIAENALLMRGQNLPVSLPPARVDQLRGIIQEKVLDRFAPNGEISGENFQRAVSDLGSEARNLMHHGNDSDQRGLGLAVQEAQSTLRDMLARTGIPQHAAAFRANNEAYANMLRIQGAAARQGAEEGVFSPAQLSASVRAYDATKHKNAFASGGALMQDLSDAGKAVLGNKLPDSGTPFRSSLATLLGTSGAGVASGAIDPARILAALGGGAAAVGAYSNPGRSLLANMIASRPAGALGLSSNIRQLSPLSAELAAQR